MTTIDCALARTAYGEGEDPIDHAIFIAQTCIEVRDTISVARAAEPNAFPIFKLSLETDAVARRIIGQLLDAGWIPPEVSSK